MNENRPPSEFERQVLEQLIQQARFDRAIDLDSLQVQEMPDGGMGSLYLVHPTKDRSFRKLGQRVSEMQFADHDGIRVIASLNVDKEGDLFELDIWKTNFQPLKMGKDKGKPKR
jgi:hypothetical protein